MRAVIPKLAMLSGKGGSGKTTVALSLAKMLNDCGILVLLIDCDIATNGATYFFETKLGKKEHYLSLTGLFNHSPIHEPILKVEDCFWFVPSNIYFPNDGDDIAYQDINLFLDNLEILIKKFGFEAVIFDCQAGYSKMLSVILEASTINLVVMEPDAISSSSIRVLYAQTSVLIEKVKTFQIFNKITDEEYSIYKQIIGGTTFNSLPPIKFNWEVRKAFAFAKVPEMISTNVEFGKDVFTLASILFSALEKRLFAYTRMILIEEKDELELTVKKLQVTKNDVLSGQKTSLIKKISSKYIVLYLIELSTVVAFTFTLSMLFDSFDVFTLISDAFVNPSILAIVIIVLGLFFVNMSLVRKYNNEKVSLRQEEQKAKAKYEYELTILLKRISEIDKIIKREENFKQKA